MGRTVTKFCTLNEEIEMRVAAAEATFRPLIVGSNCRLQNGASLWGQFEQAIAAFRQHGSGQISGLIERVNELAVAKQLAADVTLAGAVIQYEPEIVAGGKKFDFVVTEVGGKILYVEVKTVEPRTEDSEINWQKFRHREKHLTPGNHYVVDKAWMGAAISANSFKARTSFLTYTLETEAKHRDHNAQKPGRAVLVFCGTGFAWDMSELEDFADFYKTESHRRDDPFGVMELYSMGKTGVGLSRSLEGFAALMRKHDEMEPFDWVFPVLGP